MSKYGSFLDVLWLGAEVDDINLEVSGAAFSPEETTECGPVKSVVGLVPLDDDPGLEGESSRDSGVRKRPHSDIVEGPQGDRLKQVARLVDAPFGPRMQPEADGAGILPRIARHFGHFEKPRRGIVAQQLGKRNAYV
ncbi:MAG: hypothetical protein ACREP9_15675 [Candidatus Dormibacteraceae bacterium]